MKLYEVPLDPSTNSTIKIKLYRNVKNIPELRKKIIAGELKCCILKTTLIFDPFQIVVAANKALVAENQQKLITKTVFSEILYNLSLSKNVSNSLPLFGIDDKYTDILIAIINKNDENEKIFDQINGDETDLEQLKNLRDLKGIKKVYHINGEEEKCNSNDELLKTIVNKIVIKDFS